MGQNETKKDDSDTYRNQRSINMSEKVNKNKQASHDEFENNITLSHTSCSKWQGVNALLEKAGLNTISVQYQDGAINVNPDNICEAIIHLTNKNKTWQKKLSEIDQINQGLTNQLKHLQSKN